MPTLDELDLAAEKRWLDAWLSGPKRTRWEDLPPQVGDPAPDPVLPDTNGAERHLSEFWAKGPALVIFLRHFGCSCLAERWETLRDELSAYAEAGATVVGVCQAEPERARAVAERRGYPFPLLGDPGREAYAAFGLLEGLPPQLLHDFPWSPGDRKSADEIFLPRRGSERAPVDSPWQLPGEFVVAPDGRIAHAHRAQYCEDHPAAGVLLGAIAAAGSMTHRAAE